MMDDDDDDVYVYNKVIPQRSSLSCTGYQDEARDHHQELVAPTFGDGL